MISICVGGAIKAESLSLEDRVLGVDDIKLPQDTLQLMNSNLLDYQIEYDIYYAQKKYEKVAESLHKISLTYYQLGEFDLAQNYAWRLRNVSNKYAFLKSELYANALLYKINQKQGNEVLARKFLEEYKTGLEEVPDWDMKYNQEDFGEKANIEKDKSDALSGKNEVGMNRTIENSQEATLMNRKYYLWTMLLVLALGLTFIMFRAKFIHQNKFEYVQMLPEKNFVENEIEQNQELKSIRVNSYKEIENNPVSESNDNLKEMDMERKEDSYQKSEERANKSQKLSPELIISKRAGGIFEESFEKKVPLWVSGIEHHLRDLNSINGIRYEFNYSGDFNLIKENAQNFITRFLISISETLVDANNVKSVSAQLVNSDEGVVAMIISKPINVNMPILDVITVSSIRKIFMSSNKFVINTHNVPGGMLKFVLKKHSTKREFV